MGVNLKLAANPWKRITIEKAVPWMNLGQSFLPEFANR